MKNKKILSQALDDAETAIDDMIAAIKDFRENELSEIKNKLEKVLAISIDNNEKDPFTNLSGKREALQQRLKNFRMLEFDIIEADNKHVSMIYTLAGTLGKLSPVSTFKHYENDEKLYEKAEKITERYEVEIKNAYDKTIEEQLDGLKDFVGELIEEDIEELQDLEATLEDISENE